jgi:hypothetical protein
MKLLKSILRSSMKLAESILCFLVKKLWSEPAAIKELV